MRGSYLIILRRNEFNKQYTKKAFNKLVDDKRWLVDDFKPDKLELSDLQTFQKINDFKCISIQNRTEYDILLEAHFTSGFNCLIQEFNMNAYNKYGEKIITLPTAKEMVQAINYILSLKYSRQTELILNNYYINVFEDLYSLFYRRYSNYKAENEDEDFQNETIEDDKEGIYYLKKLKTTLDTYILLEQENSYISNLEHILIYKNY